MRNARAAPRSPGTAAAAAVALALGWPAVASALVLTITPGPRQIYLQVGTGSANASNGTVDLVSVSVPMGQVGDGTALPMSTNGTAAASFSGSGLSCTLPQQVYVGAWARKPGSGGAGGNTVVLQVTTPAALGSGSATLPFSQIGWTSTGNGLGGADIAAGSFTGGTQQLATVGANRWVENCLAFVYANTVVAGAGTFTGRAVFTLLDP
jgi:hypothetical protein